MSWGVKFHGFFGCLRHNSRIIAKKLNARRALFFSQGHQPGRFFIAELQRPGTDHFRHNIRRPKAPAQRAEGTIRYTCHRRQNDAAIKR